ncbi:hypothetical protein QE369_000718 [Agrobacterium larrymoorei]|uniref:Uncharacterized protein n=1 Tax=Agrobacterium larrymoorei TaxID=160699 RepID=A0AAJ2EPU3_9HYPH|nr:hypothetical protein [Agrobacterium larrymoorei]
MANSETSRSFSIGDQWLQPASMELGHTVLHSFDLQTDLIGPADRGACSGSLSGETMT